MRRASSSDIPVISGMAEKAFRETYKNILSPEQIDYMMDMMYSDESLRNQIEMDGHIYLMEDGKGYASFRPDGFTESGIPRFHLEKLYVLPGLTGKGVGSRLFNAVTEEISKFVKGSFIVELNVNRNNPAIGFYEHIGMHKARSGDFDIGNGFYMNDYIMAKEYNGKKTLSQARD